jgi:hypothetical protein
MATSGPRDYLSPNVGAGLLPAVNRGVGPLPHGRVINPPNMSKYGGFESPNIQDGPKANPMISIRKPGFEK